MLPLRLLRNRDFAGANLLTLLLYAALGGGLFFLPLNLIQVQGLSATAAGAALLPFILIMFMLSRWAGGLVDVADAIWAQRDYLAAIALPQGLPADAAAAARHAVHQAFVAGYRCIMVVSAGLAVASAGVAMLCIRGGARS